MKTTDSRSTWEKYITQSPKTPREAFLKTSGNIFPTIELNSWLAEIEVTKKAQDMAMIGELYWEKDKVKWMPNNDLKPINKFPLKPTEDKTGCIVIWEHPYHDPASDEIPFGYILVVRIHMIRIVLLLVRLVVHLYIRHSKSLIRHIIYQ